MPTTITPGFTGPSYRDTVPAGILQSVTELQCAQPGTSTKGKVHVLYPVAARSGRSTVVYGGHGMSYCDVYGINAIPHDALARGDIVLGVCQPLMGYNDATMTVTCPDTTVITSLSVHDYLSNNVVTHRGNMFAYWLDQVAIALNYVKANDKPKEIRGIGFSAGGWAIEWYAALDPTMKDSVSISGSNPFGFVEASGAEWQTDGDGEQFQMLNGYVRPWWTTVGSHTDLYTMCADTPNRKHVHAQTRTDKFFGTDYNIAAMALLDARIQARTNGRARVFTDAYAVPGFHVVRQTEVDMALATIL